MKKKWFCFILLFFLQEKNINIMKKLTGFVSFLKKIWKKFSWKNFFFAKSKIWKMSQIRKIGSTEKRNFWKNIIKHRDRISIELDPKKLSNSQKKKNPKQR